MEFYYNKVYTLFGRFKFKSTQALNHYDVRKLYECRDGWAARNKVCGCFGGGGEVSEQWAG